MRILRSDAIVTLQQDYVLLAKAKGLRNAHILLRHVLKPSSFTLITVAGLTIGTLIGGALVVETRRPLADRLDKQSGDRLVEPISQEALMRAAHVAVGAGQGRRARPESDRGICSACARLSQDEAVRAGARGPQRGAKARFRRLGGLDRPRDHLLRSGRHRACARRHRAGAENRSPQRLGVLCSRGRPHQGQGP
jgi:Binding-protein-dependent transport system inner membrane component